MTFEETNQRNIKIFKKTGVDNDLEERYTCVLCQKPTCIAESISYRGSHLICWHCRVSSFPSFFDARNWVEGEGEEEKQ